MNFAVGAKSDVGRGRPANEDAYLVDENGRLFAVADGMGGHRAGEVASATAIEKLQAAFREGTPLDEAVAEANAAVFAKASANLDMRGMGTTLTAAALVDDHTALFGHVGDSRAYLMRDGGVTQVTEDHSLVEQLVREGRLSPEEAVNHPQRAIITRALGVDPEVEVDTYRVDLRPGDRLLLCSDGLTNMVVDSEIAGVLRQGGGPQRAAETLVEMANRAGGDDNITVVVIDALGDAAGAAEALGDATPEEPTGEWVPFEDDDEPSPVPPAPLGAAERPPPGDEAGGPSPRAEGRRSRARRVALWLLPVLLVVGSGFAAVGWYARRTFYVGLAGERVTVFRGVPGGLMGWDPTVEARSDLRAGDLGAADRADLEQGHRFASRSEALEFVERLEERAGDTTPTTEAPDAELIPPTTPSTTSTTRGTSTTTSSPGTTR